MPYLHITFNSFVHLTGFSSRAHSPSMEFISIVVTDVYVLLEATAFLFELAQFSSSIKVPTQIAVIVFGNINLTNLPFELPNDKQQMTCPCGQNTTLECFVSNTDAYHLLQALLGLSDHVMLLLSSVQTGLFSLQLAWDTFDDMKTSHSTSLRVKICAPSQPLTANCSFLRSRPRRSSMLETSSRLEEKRNTESPLCHYFIPPIQTAFCVIHARTLRNTLSF